MPTPEIIEKVRALDRQLAETPDLPAHVKPDVDAIKKQIDAILLEPDKVPHYTSLNDRLLFAYVKFESDHPQVAKAIVDVTNALAAAGL